MYVAKCEIKFSSEQGTFSLDRATSIEIRKSTQLLTDTALIRLPTMAVMRDRKATTTVEVAHAIEVGMSVNIRLWYQGYEDQEISFSGYVRRINPQTPVEIECEDQIGLLRWKNINRSWKDTTLEEILKDITEGMVPLAKGIPRVPLKMYYLKNRNGIEALQKIKDEFGYSLYMNANQELYCGLAYQEHYGEVCYMLNGKNINVIETDKLQWQNQEDVQVCVKAITVKEDNSCQIAVVGDAQGAIQVFRFNHIDSDEQLKLLAEQELRKLKFSGYRGKITAFLLPGVIPGMVAEITDDKYSRPGGKYFIESVKTTWGRHGCRNEVELGIKMI